MRHRVRRPAQALTLIELLVGMGIISLMFVVLGYIFFQATRAHSLGAGQAEIHQQARAVFDYLARELRGVPRDGRVIVTSPNGALTRWGVVVHGDVIAFTTSTPLPVRRSAVPGDGYRSANLGAVSYYRWLPLMSVGPERQRLYRALDRLDDGDTLGALNRRLAPWIPPSDPPPGPTTEGKLVEEELAIRVVTPFETGSAVYGAFEAEVFDAAGALVPIADAAQAIGGSVEDYDSNVRGLPRAIRVRLRSLDRNKHIRDEETNERGLELTETFWLPAAQ